MKCCISKEEKEATERSNAIDKAIEEDAKKLKKECKVLLLGSGESGKSTIVRQMKIIHQNGYTEQELKDFIPLIHSNAFESIISLIKASKKFSIEFETEQAKIAATVLQSMEPSFSTPTFTLTQNYYGVKVTPQVADYIESIWTDPTSEKLMMKSGEFYIMDSGPYFFNNVKRISEETYIPSTSDVLHVRVRTTGITQTWFTMGQLDIHMFDVGGQRSERRKWIHCFEAVTSIIFCVALSEYDQTLLEDPSQNRMVESLSLFESVINSRWFLRTSIILFLNKIDVFKIKLSRNPLEKYFPEYGGEQEDITQAAKFILWMFTQKNRAGLNIYPHLTQATDTSNIKLVFAAVKVTILHNALKDSGIV